MYGSLVSGHGEWVLGLGFRVESHWFVCETTCMGVW
jgi:hypothetical protein